MGVFFDISVTNIRQYLTSMLTFFQEYLNRLSLFSLSLIVTFNNIIHVLLTVL